jgi:hypothetical protein
VCIGKEKKKKIDTTFKEKKKNLSFFFSLTHFPFLFAVVSILNKSPDPMTQERFSKGKKIFVVACGLASIVIGFRAKAEAEIKFHESIERAKYAEELRLEKEKGKKQEEATTGEAK